MQNTTDILENKIINIKSELLFREAEDDFYYFNKPLSALKKLHSALELTPFHLKSIVLAADICFCRGNIKKAMRYYSVALSLSPKNTKFSASLGNCHKILGNNKKALAFFNNALENDNLDNISLSVQILELKAQCAIALKLYSEAKSALQKLNFIASDQNISDYLLYDYFLLYNKLKIHNKIKDYELRVI